MLVDAHVHLHECFSPVDFLESAWTNFDLAASRHGWSWTAGVLMLTESEGADAFGWLSRHGSPNMKSIAVPLGTWSIEASGDPLALWARSGVRTLLIVAGRQVVVREGLEVLTLGTTTTIPDRRALVDVLAEAKTLGALRVIPWGAGKWFFGRGELLRGVIESQRGDDGFFLGDGAGRPFFWPEPSHFRFALERGIRVLPGSDPLPFPSQQTRAGIFGFRLEARIDLAAPGEAIKSALRDPSSRLTPFGSAERLLPFVSNQIAMQRRKRRPAVSGGLSR